MCPLGPRVRYADASLGGHLAGTVPGAAKVETAEDPERGGNSTGGANCGERLATVLGGHVALPRQLPTQA